YTDTNTGRGVVQPTSQRLMSRAYSFTLGVAGSNGADIWAPSNQPPNSRRSVSDEGSVIIWLIMGVVETGALRFKNVVSSP
ncbi:basic helix-loop-helix DNA-binding superfamily protein, partial [Perilla frutescens var. frutescens]